MRVDDFDFHLPAELIAQEPAAERGADRLLHLERASGAVRHRRFADLPELLAPGDLLVVNDTRVFPARLIGRRLPGGGAAECFLVRETAEPDTWIALVHPGQRLAPGARMVFERNGRVLEADVVGRHFQGRRTVRLQTPDGSPVRGTVEAIGHVPLPPYIRRADDEQDRERYQTIYARAPGSIAAPTAGLHFTDEIRSRLADRGVGWAALTLHVGYGTFQPVRVQDIEQHTMESEEFDVPPATIEALRRTRAAGGRIVAVGTTTTRTLESLRLDEIEPGAGTRGDTALFIRPGHEFRLVSGLVTNFHLPRSSLLMLVSAFAGREAVLGAYREAVDLRYRFYSYGDAMAVL